LLIAWLSGWQAGVAVLFASFISHRQTPSVCIPIHSRCCSIALARHSTFTSFAINDLAKTSRVNFGDDRI